MNKTIVYVMLLLLSISFVFAGSVTHEQTRRLSSVGADPLRISVRFLVTVGYDDCGKSICGYHTLSDDFKGMQTWSVYDSPGSTLVGACEIASSDAGFVKICCSPPSSKCSEPLGSGQAGWSMSGLVNVYGTGSMNYCYERVGVQNTVGKFDVGSKWCNFAVASKCLSGGMISSDQSKMGTIIRDDCGAKGDTCVRGECVDGCKRREETYPKGGSAYRAGTRVCLDSPYLSECQSDGTWDVVEECRSGCNEGTNGCKYDSSYLCTLKMRQGNSMITSSVKDGSVYCLDGEISYGNSYGGDEEIVGFTPGIYLCDEGLWVEVSECNNDCLDVQKCDDSSGVVDPDNEFDPETSDDTGYLEGETGYSVAPSNYFSLWDFLQGIIDWFKGLFN